MAKSDKKNQTKTNQAPKVKKEFKILELKSNGSKGSALALDDIIADAHISESIMYDYEVMYQVNQRAGTAHTKDRSEVSGGGKKPWKQKGTGRARVGSNRSPLWIKGGVTFGPRKKDFSYSMPKQVKALALIAGLQKKAANQKLFLVDEFKVLSGKTKEVAETVNKYQLDKPIFIRDAHDATTLRATRNLCHVALGTARDVSAHDVMNSAECVLTKNGYDALVERLKKGAA